MKAYGTPGVKITKEQFENDVGLPDKKISPYRAVVARANYLAADRPDCQYASKEVCRWMSKPTEVSLKAVKRLGRYLRGRPRLVWRYPWQKVDTLDVYSDTDW